MAHLDYRSNTRTPSLFTRRGAAYAAFGKRIVDLSIAVLLLPVLIPLIAVLCALCARTGSFGLFAHQRVGQHGVPFTCWKIRTMVPDAEQRLRDHLAADPVAAAEWARTQKLTRDPRVTALGRVLRRTSLDELPQIWNVLRGDMSLVGPRPITAPELDRYGPHAQTYLSLKPGVTGLWQVAGRANGCYDERLQMDQTYAQTMGLFGDLSLIAQTAVVVIRPTGR